MYNKVSLEALLSGSKITDDDDFRWLFDNGFMPYMWDPAEEQMEIEFTREYPGCTKAPDSDHYRNNLELYDIHDVVTESASVYINLRKEISWLDREHNRIVRQPRWTASVGWSSFYAPLNALEVWRERVYSGDTPAQALQELMKHVDLDVLIPNLEKGGQIQ